MRQKLAIGVICAALASCALPIAPRAPPGDLRADRQACNNAYPPHVGNYLPHADCVNAAIERDAIPFAHYPDLIRLQEQIRRKYSAEIDRGVLTAAAGSRKMEAADAMVKAAEYDRDTDHAMAAEHRLDSLEALLRQ